MCDTHHSSVCCLLPVASSELTCLLPTSSDVPMMISRPAWGRSDSHRWKRDGSISPKNTISGLTTPWNMSSILEGKTTWYTQLGWYVATEDMHSIFEQYTCYPASLACAFCHFSFQNSFLKQVSHNACWNRYSYHNVSAHVLVICTKISLILLLPVLVILTSISLPLYLCRHCRHVAVANEPCASTSNSSGIPATVHIAKNT